MGIRSRKEAKSHTKAADQWVAKTSIDSPAPVGQAGFVRLRSKHADDGDLRSGHSKLLLSSATAYIPRVVDWAHLHPKNREMRSYRDKSHARREAVAGVARSAG